MIRKLSIVLVTLSILFFQVTTVFSSDREIKEDNINVEPIEGKPQHYSVNIKFSRIDKVLVRTTITAESSGQKKESFILPKNEWNYSYDYNRLVVTRAIDDFKYIIRVIGKYQTPICIIPNEPIDSSHIRLVVDGKIGIPDKDYRYNKDKNMIELMACKTGKEKYIIAYDYTKGCASIGSASTSDLTLPLLKYLNFPIEGNSVALDKTGLKFTTKDFYFKSVWMVQLIPTDDGYTGQDLHSGFQWDPIKRELTLDKPVDTEKFTLMIYGEID